MAPLARRDRRRCVDPLVLLIAASRVILGLHYPSDMLAGALLGGAIAYCSFWIVG